MKFLIKKLKNNKKKINVINSCYSEEEIKKFIQKTILK